MRKLFIFFIAVPFTLISLFVNVHAQFRIVGQMTSYKLGDDWSEWSDFEEKEGTMTVDVEKSTIKITFTGTGEEKVFKVESGSEETTNDGKKVLVFKCLDENNVSLTLKSGVEIELKGNKAILTLLMYETSRIAYIMTGSGSGSSTASSSSSGSSASSGKQYGKTVLYGAQLNYRKKEGNKWSDWSGWMNTDNAPIVIDVDNLLVTVTIGDTKYNYKVQKVGEQEKDNEGNVLFPIYCKDDQGRDVTVNIAKLVSEGGKPWIYVKYDHVEYVYKAYQKDGSSGYSSGSSSSSSSSVSSSNKSVFYGTQLNYRSKEGGKWSDWSGWFNVNNAPITIDYGSQVISVTISDKVFNYSIQSVGDQTSDSEGNKLLPIKCKDEKGNNVNVNIAKLVSEDKPWIYVQYDNVEYVYKAYLASGSSSSSSYSSSSNYSSSTSSYKSYRASGEYNNIWLSFDFLGLTLNYIDLMPMTYGLRFSTDISYLGLSVFYQKSYLNGSQLSLLSENSSEKISSVPDYEYLELGGNINVMTIEEDDMGFGFRGGIHASAMPVNFDAEPLYASDAYAGKYFKYKMNGTYWGLLWNFGEDNPRVDFAFDLLFGSYEIKDKRNRNMSQIIVRKGDGSLTTLKASLKSGMGWRLVWDVKELYSGKLIGFSMRMDLGSYPGLRPNKIELKYLSGKNFYERLYFTINLGLTLNGKLF